MRTQRGGPSHQHLQHIKGPVAVTSTRSSHKVCLSVSQATLVCGRVWAGTESVMLMGVTLSPLCAS